MAVTTPPTISALPTPPSTSDPATFDTRADAFMAALPTHTTETNAASANVYANAVDSAASASAASTSASNASSSAATAVAAAVAAAGATIWVSGTTYAIGDVRYSPANGSVYRRKTVGAGTTDPSADTTNWQLVELLAPALPTIRPTLLLDFANSRTVSPRVTFTRASGGTICNKKGVRELVPADVPRIDYDPVTLACKGVLTEELRTNSVLNSTIDGANLATQSVTVTAAAHTLSFYGTGTVTLSGVSTAGPLVGSGAYPTRSTLTFTPTAGTLTLTVTGTVQFCNLELGAFATSYIPTAGSTVTRAADLPSMSGANFSSWYNQSEGTFVVEGDATFSGSTFPTLVEVDDGTGANIIYLNSRSSTLQGRMESSGGAAASSGTLVSGTTFKEAGAYKLNDYALSVNGATVVPDTSATVPAVNRMNIGCERGVSGWLNGHIARLAYYPKRLTNAELQTLTE